MLDLEPARPPASRRARPVSRRVRERASPRASASPIAAGPATAGCSRRVRWAWRTRIQVHYRARPAHAALAGAPRTRRCRSSPATCATCCSPRPPARAPTMGLDPGFRTGVKVAVVDATGKVVDDRHDLSRTSRSGAGTRPLRDAGRGCARQHKVELIAIGNGTASRETDKLAAELVAKQPGPEAHQGDGLGGRRLGLFRLGLRRRRSCPTSTCRCAARSRSRAACRTRWPSW